MISNQCLLSEFYGAIVEYMIRCYSMEDMVLFSISLLT